MKRNNKYSCIGYFDRAILLFSSCLVATGVAIPGIKILADLSSREIKENQTSANLSPKNNVIRETEDKFNIETPYSAIRETKDGYELTLRIDGKKMIYNHHNSNKGIDTLAIGEIEGGNREYFIDIGCDNKLDFVFVDNGMNYPKAYIRREEINEGELSDFFNKQDRKYEEYKDKVLGSFRVEY